jgi:branched-subunit amino acid ABC-type transport system permease component
VNALLPFLVSGVVTGSLYGLTGLGLVLTYRTSGVFNFGHGAIAAAGAYLFYTLSRHAGLPWPLAGAITVLGFGLVGGFILERVIGLLQGAAQVVVIVATVGVLLAVQGTISLIYGGATRYFPAFLPKSGFLLSGVKISWGSVISFTIAAACAGGLYVFMARNRLGVAMRAVVDNPSLVGHCGDSPTRIRLAAWMIGSAFAALSGILLAPTLGLDSVLLTLLVVQAFGACAIGRFSSLPLTYLGGLIVGVVASVATKYLVKNPWAGIPSSVPFLILIGALLVTPKRKLPDQRRDAQSMVATFRSLSARTQAVQIAMGAALALMVPFVVGTKLPVWINFLSSFVLFGSLALLVWTSGQISLCHAAFAAVGATSVAHLTSGGVPWGLALPMAGLLVVPVGALVALTSVRLSGLYLALATLGFGILMQNVVFATGPMFGKGIYIAIKRPHLAHAAATDKQLYFLFLIVAALVCAALITLNRSRLGRLLRGLSEAPTMLTTQGLAVNSLRLIGFCFSAFFAGIAGAMLASQTGSASGVGYGPLQSLLLLAVLGLSGTRLIRSAVVAAFLYAVFPAYVSSLSADLQPVAFGVAAILAAVVIAKTEWLRRWFGAAAAASADRLRHGPASDRVHRPRPWPVAEGIAMPTPRSSVRGLVQP